tara:strand:+ start:6593 stop:7171 length:579 start_codon:yes stop_codon:yes gene_type:complete
MKITSINNEEGLNIKDIALITPQIFPDSRGFFFESWNQVQFNSLISNNITFVQDNQSFSKKAVLRGMHYQLAPYDQGKLVRCLQGTIYDVAVDLRISSPTFSKWIGVILSSKNNNQLWIPSGFAHGFLTLSESAQVLYKATNFYSPISERSIIWNDPKISIKWPKEIKDPILSEKDLDAPRLEEISKENLFL